MATTRAQTQKLACALRLLLFRYPNRPPERAQLMIVFSPDLGSYQHIALRNLANVRTRAQPGTRSQAQAGAASSRRADKAPTTSK